MDRQTRLSAMSDAEWYMYPLRSVSPLGPLKTLIQLHFLSVNPLQTLGEMSVGSNIKGFLGVFLMERSVREA